MQELERAGRRPVLETNRHRGSKGQASKVHSEPHSVQTSWNPRDLSGVDRNHSSAGPSGSDFEKLRKPSARIPGPVPEGRQSRRRRGRRSRRAGSRTRGRRGRGMHKRPEGPAGSDPSRRTPVRSAKTSLPAEKPRGLDASRSSPAPTTGPYTSQGHDDGERGKLRPGSRRTRGPARRRRHESIHGTAPIRNRWFRPGPRSTPC